ncbi:hypothetical protein BB559_001571 [Furculomyces boomerangus]|uniref:DUF7137 domain-containing protein n=2 Tax=Harpellales TaxID=61421 RepID=A0A2T9XYI8_9FUNG|nr:hypothetical protein BB559_007206 [Furculomyces boomerangus]PVU98440.1 hypothetical protein BB559_001571 [Furculomyces boomerangus]PWA01065.1 hypothetical protein BB558_002851 [Smittium angustum]
MKSVFLRFMGTLLVLFSISFIVSAQNSDSDTGENQTPSPASQNSAPNSPSQSQGTASPSQSQGTASPTKNQNAASPTSSDQLSFPGQFVMITPPNIGPNPLFEIGSIVKLSWDYDDNTVHFPGKVMIIGTMPNNGNFIDPSTKKPYTWVIANNITELKYDWDTTKQTPKGISLTSASGYVMTLYDGDTGLVNGTVAMNGYVTNKGISFSMYVSDYNSTNDGIPRGYNPSGSTSLMHSFSMSLLVVCFLAIFYLV